MIIIGIKLCVTTYPGATIDMYFQTDDASLYHFYIMHGCQQINQGSSDGFNLLPLDMVAGLAHCRELNPDIKFSNFTFHIEVEGFSVPPPKLMRLRHDKLRNKKQDQGIESKLIQEIQENVGLEADVVIPVTRVWCQYPPRVNPPE